MKKHKKWHGEMSPRPYDGMEEDGYYAGISYRMRIFKIPTSIIPAEAKFVRGENPFLDGDNWIFYFTHKNFRSVEEGANIPEFEELKR